MIDFRFDCRLEVNDLIEVGEGEFRRLRMVFGSVLALAGTTGGIRERNCWIGRTQSSLTCSSTGFRVTASLSRGFGEAFPSM
jgi:hypothetical protein